MLHAPTSETKTETTQSKLQLAPQPGRELHPHSFGAADAYALSGAGSAASVRSPEVQRHQIIAGMQATHGNQAVLRMMQSSLQVAHMLALRPSQGLMLQRKCACGGSSESEGECAECKAKREAMLQRSVGNQAAPSAAPTVRPIVHDVLRSPGQPLDAGTRAFMEPRFGHDFSQVRIHTDARAAESARAVNALAYTVGSNVVFGAGQFAPGTSEGRRLMAHELTHVVQQHDSMPAATLPWSQPDDRFEREAAEVADALLGRSSELTQISERSPAPILSRDNAGQTAAVLHLGTVRNTGLQFFPLQFTSTRIGPVSGEGGLANDSRNRLSVIVGQSMTLRRLANLLLPLWNSAEPFTPPGSAAPVVTPPLTAEVLARGLLVYNRYYLGVVSQPAPSMTGWMGGLRFPLPIEIDESGQGVVNSDLIQSLAGDFSAAWEPLLDRPASAVIAPPAVDLHESVAAFLDATPGDDARGIALSARAITNPVEASPFVAEAFNQLGSSRFDVALAFMDSSVSSEIALLASQRAGAAILGSIRIALAATPPTLSSSQQESLTRANLLLGLVAAATPRDMPFIQPTRTSANGVHMVAGFEGFCANLYDDAMPRCGLGRGNCTIGFGHLVHHDPCDGRASETPFLAGITHQQGEALLAGELAASANRVHNRVTVPLSQEQFDALVSFDFNTGRLDALLPDINANHFANVPALMNQFIHAQGVVLPGLVARRAAEGRLFSTGVYPP